MDTPPDETPEVALGNLPIQITPLLGRATALAELAPMLRVGRLLTLCGPGGAGKSRLAVTLAETVREEFPGGAWWADLSATIDDALVGQVVAAAVAPGVQPSDPPAAIAAQLSTTSLLLLDNTEQVAEGCAHLVADLLARVPTLRIVVTGRQSLGIPGEQVWRTPGLAVASSAEGSSDGDAVTLFLQRAQQASGTFSPGGPGIRQAVHEICLWLDGMPLAIELAAARVAVLSATQIGERLKRDGDLLSHSARAGPGRQRTLQDTLEWSHQLLSPAERRLFRRLGAFRGSFSLTAAEAVCADQELAEAEVLTLLSVLIDQSLVQVVESAQTPRYRLLSVVRQYSQSKLRTCNEHQSTHRRHADFYLRLAQTARTRVMSSDQTLWLDSLELEHDNLSEALLWLFGSSPVQAAELASALWPFFYQRGYYNEARSWFERTLTLETAIPRSARVDALLKAGEVSFLECDYAEAIGRLGEVLQLIGDEGEGNRRTVAIAHQRLGAIAREQGRYDEARRLHEQSMKTWEALGDSEGTASSLYYLSFTAWLSGDLERAESAGNHALQYFRDAGNLRDVAAVLISLGATAIYEGKFERAAERLQEALTVSRRLGFQEGIAWSLHELAILSRRGRQSPAAAAVMLDEALRVHQQLGDRWRGASVLEEIAASVLLRRDPSAAVRLLACAQALRDRIGAPIPPVEAADREAARSRLRRRLTASAYDAAQAEGRQLELSQAVDLAVRALQSDEGSATIALILTDRELAVLELLTQGRTNREIAAALFISPSTAGVHVSNIVRKLGAKRRVDAARLAHTMGLLVNGGDDTRSSPDKRNSGAALRQGGAHA